MRAELDTVSGQPVLRLENGGSFKRAVFDLQLTPEQARKIAIHTEVAQ